MSYVIWTVLLVWLSFQQFISLELLSHAENWRIIFSERWNVSKKQGKKPSCVPAILSSIFPNEHVFPFFQDWAMEVQNGKFFFFFLRSSWRIPKMLTVDNNVKPSLGRGGGLLNIILKNVYPFRAWPGQNKQPSEQPISDW